MSKPTPTIVRADCTMRSSCQSQSAFAGTGHCSAHRSNYLRSTDDTQIRSHGKSQRRSLHSGTAPACPNGVACLSDASLPRLATLRLAGQVAAMPAGATLQPSHSRTRRITLLGWKCELDAHYGRPSPLSKRCPTCVKTNRPPCARNTHARSNRSSGHSRPKSATPRPAIISGML